jgi:uncharacterized damage-inducible protein DinB
VSIEIKKLLLHMAWANQLTIEHLEGLSEDALKAFAVKENWYVGEIAHHIVEAADFYVYRITGRHCELPGKEIQELKVKTDLVLLKSQVAEIDRALIACANLEDSKVEFVNSKGEKVSRWISTILSQAVHHATEHRAQIASALEAKGFKPVDLDELDLWSFEIKNG